ncbi:MAG: TonB-dependent receptor plug domain-containing protein [Bacteroidales bacterium]|nr:TonB-dependent receptor plug domain-containing protein [Bacteroidales bacterium]MBQ1708191.1 TonB-dependent receptor plug domain-containing protein [Bacteroidales bacterium]
MKRFLLIPVLMLALGSCGSHKNISVPAEEKPLLTDGYIDIHPDSKTNAIQHVEMKDTEKVSYRNFQDYLQSHVSGVDITASGGIVIRGMGTFNGSSDPLVLMDGTEIQDLDSINPYDIHSIDVIKDGGTAAYGLRGANGVILITSESAYQLKKAEREARQREKEAARAAKAAKKAAKKK